MTEILLITGMSGAGRSTVSAALEDVGWFVIDNLPVALIPRVSELAAAGLGDFAGVAFILGRSGVAESTAVMSAAETLRSDSYSVKILFLDAPDDVLVGRFTGNRRRHPVVGTSISDSITRERDALRQVASEAEITIDTGSLNSNQLRRRISEIFSSTSSDDSMRISISSFGFSQGLPRDADIVFDVRFLSNPHWVDDLRPLSGLDAPVSEYVLALPGTQRFLLEVTNLLSWQIPSFRAEGKRYLSIAIGCTGGRHRSVAVAEALAHQLNISNGVLHRDIDR